MPGTFECSLGEDVLQPLRLALLINMTATTGDQKGQFDAEPQSRRERNAKEPELAEPFSAALRLCVNVMKTLQTSPALRRRSELGWYLALGPVRAHPWSSKPIHQ